MKTFYLRTLGLRMLALVVATAPVLPAAESLAPTKAARPWVSDRLSVCVYCGASDLAPPKYAEYARQLGKALAARRWTLVWGGSKTGLMGAVARGAKEAGGRVEGVLPEFIRQWEVAYEAADEMIVVATMHDRKMMLQARSDATVILPGGIGTLDEIGDVLDLRSLNQNRKPIILLNQDGFYDSLLAFLDYTVAEKFTKNESRQHLLVAKSVEEIVGLLEKVERVPGTVSR